MTEIEKIEYWQKTKDPEMFKELLSIYAPMRRSVVNKYRTTGMNISTLETQAITQNIRSLKSYKPGMGAGAGASPTTHMYNGLKKVQRNASESLMSGHVPEARGMQLSTYKILKDNLQDQYGFEPNTKMMADEMGWSMKETSRAERELHGETTASNAEFDFYGNSTQQKSTDKQITDYLYHELKDAEKTVYEYTFGVGGKPKLDKNKDIAKAMGVNAMFISRKKSAIGKKIKDKRMVI